MSLVEDNDVVKALPPDRTNQAFAIRILPGGAPCNHDLLDSHVGDALTKAIAVDSVTITNQELRRFIERKRLDNLLCGPLRCWIRRDVEVDKPTSVNPTTSVASTRNIANLTCIPLTSLTRSYFTRHFKMRTGIGRCAI